MFANIPGTVRNYIQRAEQAGINWPLPDGMTEEKLEALLFPGNDSEGIRAQPDWKVVHEKFCQPGMTRERVWWWYREMHPDGYSYSQFCKLYKKWLGPRKSTLRLSHTAGDELYVDFAGTTIDVIDPSTGEVMAAQIFFATLGCSKYMYMEAVANQRLRSWIGAHVRALEFFGGVPKVIVCDNLKAAVVKPRGVNSEVTRTYQEFSEHYHCMILPARPYRPQDKSIVEGSVRFGTNRILSELRGMQFFSLGELNEAIAVRLNELNRLPFQKLEGSRHSQFENLDKPALTPLPKKRFDYREWKKCKVNHDYHVQVEYNYYSVPHKYQWQRIDVCIREDVIELRVKDEVIARHLRLKSRGKYSTDPAHLPEKYKRYLTHESWIKRAREVGKHVEILVRLILERRSEPEQNYRSVQGILGLQDNYGAARLNQACRRAVLLGERGYNYPTVASILKTMLEEETEKSEPVVLEHKNLRGGEYYKNKK